MCVYFWRDVYFCFCHIHIDCWNIYRLSGLCVEIQFPSFQEMQTLPLFSMACVSISSIELFSCITYQKVFVWVLVICFHMWLWPGQMMLGSLFVVGILGHFNARSATVHFQFVVFQLALFFSFFCFEGDDILRCFAHIVCNWNLSCEYKLQLIRSHMHTTHMHKHFEFCNCITRLAVYRTHEKKNRAVFPSRFLNRLEFSNGKRKSCSYNQRDEKTYNFVQ